MSLFSQIPVGHYIPADSFLHRLDPRTKLVFLTVFLMSVFLANNGVTHSLFLFSLFVMVVFSKISPRYLLRGLTPMFLLILLMALFHLTMTQGGDVVFRWGGVTVYEKGLEQAVQLSLRFIYILLSASLLTLTTSPMEITHGMERLMHPLKKIGVPVHELALMMSVALRFIPTLIREADKIMKAQTARGADFESRNLARRFKHWIPLLVPLFITVFRRADELSLAMEARCYQGGEGRTRFKKLSFSRRDGVPLLFILLFVAALWLFRT